VIILVLVWVFKTLKTEPNIHITKKELYHKNNLDTKPHIITGIESVNKLSKKAIVSADAIQCQTYSISDIKLIIKKKY